MNLSPQTSSEGFHGLLPQLKRIPSACPERVKKNAALLAAGFWIGSGIAGAQNLPLTDQGSQNMLQNILSESRLPSSNYDLTRVPAQVRLMTAKDIEASGAHTLQELLRSVPGVVAYDEIGNGLQETMDLRGFNATPIPTTVVLVDGVKINEPDFGTVNFQTIPLSTIERIEILPGPQSIYGKNALGGIIQITTKKNAQDREASAQADFGSFGLQRYQAAVGGAAVGPIRYRLDASKASQLGFRSNSQSNIYNFDGRLDYKDSDAEGSLLYHFTDDHLHQPGSLTASEIGQDRNQNRSFVNSDNLLHAVTLNLRRKISEDWTVSANGSARQRLENTPLNQGRSSMTQARSDQQSLDAVAQAENRVDILGRQSIFAAGVEAGHDKTNNDVSGNFGGFPYLSGNIIAGRQLGLFAQETYDLWPELLVMTAGVRWDRNGIQNEDKITPSNDGSRVYNRASPRVGLNFNPSKRWQSFASMSDNFRSPTSGEISSLGPFASTPFLKPVKARSYELGTRVSFGDKGDGSLSIFRTTTRDEIFPVFDPTAGFGQNVNIDRTQRDGLEISLRPRWNRWLDGVVNYTYTEAKFKTDFVLDKAPWPASQNVRSGAFLPQVPRNRLYLAAHVHPLSKLTVSVDELCVGSQFVFGDESNTEARLGGYCLTGFGGSYEQGKARFFVRIDNAFDRHYESRGILGTNPATFGLERYLMPAAGINVSGGVQYKFLGS